MNMKKLSAAVVIMLGLGVSAAQADDGSLNFSGKVVNGTCSVDAGSSAIPVAFNSIPAATLDALAQGETTTSLQKPFSIKLTGCTAGVVANVMFDGPNTSGRVPNAFATPANYVGVIISDAGTGAAVTPKTAVATSKAIVAGDNSLDYLLSLTKTATKNQDTGANGAGATVADMGTEINFTMSYQ